MKKILATLSVMTLFLIGCSSGGANEGVAESEEAVDVLLDATEYARISEAELIDKLGEPVEIEEPYMEGKMLSYDHNLGHLEFIIHDDAVTRMNLWSDAAWTNEGENLPYNGIDTLQVFGIEPTRDYKVNDNGFTLEVSPVSEKVANVMMEFIEEDEFGLLKATYDVGPY